jgi:hypothetical protein
MKSELALTQFFTLEYERSFLFIKSSSLELEQVNKLIWEMKKK